MKATQLELENARTTLERKTREEKRAGGRNNNKADRRKKKPANNNEEKAMLQKEIKELHDEIQSSQTSFNQLTQKHVDKGAKLEELESKKQDLLKTVDHTKYQLEDTAEKTEKYKAMVDGLEEVEEYMKKREGALWSRIDVLEGRIARESRREATEWFGPGPHRVEIELEYPKVDDPSSDPSSWPRIRNTLIIEMASLDLMPHTVNLFLQQVHYQLWDGCSVGTNPKHIMQIGPSYSDEEISGDAPHYHDFHDKGLAKVAYQEYNEQFPHEKWTIGMPGRPGGPDFYVNKINNSIVHGPGGQVNKHDLHNEADPCFGKLVEGTEKVMKEIDRIPTTGRDKKRPPELSYPVVIIGAKVMAPKETNDGWREIKAGEKLDGKDEIMPLPDVPHGV